MWIVDEPRIVPPTKPQQLDKLAVIGISRNWAGAYRETRTLRHVLVFREYLKAPRNWIRVYGCERARQRFAKARRGGIAVRASDSDVYSCTQAQAEAPAIRRSC